MDQNDWKGYIVNILFVFLLIIILLPSTVVVNTTIGNASSIILTFLFLIIIYSIYGGVAVEYVKSIGIAFFIIFLVLLYHIHNGRYNLAHNAFYPIYGVLYPVIFMFIFPNYINYRVISKAIAVFSSVVVIIGLPALIIGTYDLFWFQVQAVEYSSVTRLRSIFEGSQNSLGRFLMIGSIFAFSEYHNTSNTLWGGVVAINIFGLYLTGSRGSLAAFSIGFSIYLIYYFYNKEIYKKVYAIVLFGYSSALLFFFGLIPWPNTIKSIDFSHRFEIWDATLNASSNNIILGNGLVPRSELIAPYLYTPEIMGVNPHNGYLSILLYSGIIGLISYLSIIYQVLLLSIARDESNVLMMSVSISILTESFVEDVMIIGTGFSTIILSMCFGYLIKESEISNRIIIKQKTTD
ncbi:uncharacterized protein Nmag_0143 [Natrialba magadii ATCC 43099]|uniref:O-antigen ligase-related domain-containing protein n=2 Tax=Natrialba magadii (strain ATCC 43099 / DSM 3394 / CCM 3739 / CIP 104546 / IAM 13178 / JCM 8861 / NBRC 102185 / NCIMB 2190 / MS3) TaxID=547559 RepID=D3SWE5_NATMM|nr:O-antigen ligase family protein [Natrialba magadii]ADD03737.1 uncharacterized protein Nmag_0143 [Natrialba magadii ATCC 43099]